jgi:hypothetical protein
MQSIAKGSAVIRSVIASLILLTTPLYGLAQIPESIPPSPAYKGEIRRGADGKLMVVTPTETTKSPADGPTKAATMIVGSQEKITTITEAAKLAQDGDVIEIRPGDYRGQPAVWTRNNLLIRGAEGRPVMIADGKNAEGKAIWVVRGANVRIENVEFRGARAASGNGAGIYVERGHLSIARCAFFDNEIGLLTANFPEMALEVSDSEFAAAPHHEGQPHHLLHVGAIGRFVLSGSRFSQGYLGSLVKSRARESHVRYNMLLDGVDGRSSYELEFPNGGIAYVVGNTIGQSAGTDNPVLISYGAEGGRWPDNALFLAHNTLINDLHAGTFLKLWSEKLSGGIEAWVINNLSVGDGDLFPPAQGRFEGNKSAPRRDLIEYGGQRLRLSSASSLRGAVRIPGHARGVDLLPDAEFSFPAGSRSIRISSALVPGAFQ